MTKQRGWTLTEGFGVAWLLLWLAAGVGWVLNIIALVHEVGGPITTMFIARCVGVFVAPLGCVLGWL